MNNPFDELTPQGPTPLLRPGLLGGETAQPRRAAPRPSSGNPFDELVSGVAPRPASGNPFDELVPVFGPTFRQGLATTTALQTVQERAGVSGDQAAQIDRLMRQTGREGQPVEAFLRPEDQQRLEFERLQRVAPDLAAFGDLFTSNTLAAALAQDDIPVLSFFGNAALRARAGFERFLVGATEGQRRDDLVSAMQALLDKDKTLREIFEEEKATETGAGGFDGAFERVRSILSAVVRASNRDLVTPDGKYGFVPGEIVPADYVDPESSDFAGDEPPIVQIRKYTFEEGVQEIAEASRRIAENVAKIEADNALTPAAQRRREKYQKRLGDGGFISAARNAAVMAVEDPLLLLENLAYTVAESTTGAVAFALTSISTRRLGKLKSLALSAVATGSVSANTERANAFTELAQELGFDVTDDAQLMQMLQHPEFLLRLSRNAERDALTTGLADTLAGGLTGVLPISNALKLHIAEALIDGSAGAVGEVLAAKAAETEAKGADVFNEFLAGAAMSPIQIGASAVSDRVSRVIQEERRVALERKTFEAIADRSKASKLRGRSRELFQKMVDRGLGDTPLENVYVRARGVVEALEAAAADGSETPSLTLSEFLEALPEDTRQLFNEAVESDGSVPVPTSFFAANIIGSKIETIFRDNATFSPDGVTAAELRKQQAEIDRLIAEFDDPNAAPDDSFEARQLRAVRAQVIAAGRSPQEAEQVAAMQVGRIRTLAAELNVPFEVVARQFPIMIQGVEREAGDIALTGSDVERLLDEVRSPGVAPSAAGLRLRAALIEEGVDPFTVDPVEASAILLRRLDTLPRLAEARRAQPTTPPLAAGSVTSPANVNPEVRPQVVFGRDLEGTGLETEEFFGDVTAGTRQQPKNLDQYVPAFKVTPEVVEFQKAWERFSGNFDAHIKTSIPGYREMQDSVGWTIREYLDEKGGGSILDIGASEGAMVKAIVSTADSDITAIALDPNTQMRDTFHEKPQVEGVTFSLTAFGSAEQEGQVAWQAANGEDITFFDPQGQKFDIVHESMVFQFISNARGAQVRRAKELLKPDGIMIIAEKVSDADPNVFLENEVAKDEYKARHYDAEQLEQKRQEVLRAGDAVEGMTAKLATRQEVDALLALHFENVTQIWDSGNFKAWAVSDSAENLQRFVGLLPDLNSEFSTVRTPREVVTEEALPGSAFRSALLAGMQLSEDDLAVARRRGLSLSQRPDLTITIPDTPDFQEFLADTKVRDEDGNVLGLWHGTGAEFEVFDPSRGAQRFGKRGAGFFFSTSRGVAVEAAMMGRKPRLLKGVARATNPVVFKTTTPSANAFWLENTSIIVRAVEEQDADAVIIRSPRDTLVILFDSKQFKSIEDRQAPVDRENPNIFQQEDLSVPVTRADFVGVPRASVFRRPGWFVITGTQARLGDFTSVANVESQNRLRGVLEARGLDYMETRGVYMGVDDGPSFLVFGDEAQAPELGREFGQDSVLTREGLVFSDGRPNVPIVGVRFGEDARAQDFHTVMPNGVVWSLDLDFSTHENLPDAQEGLTLNQASLERLTNFQSALVRQVLGAKQKTAPAKDWAAILRKLPGVTKLELEWTGVLAWLATQEGQVDRAAVVDFIQANLPDLVEVRLTGNPTDKDLENSYYEVGAAVEVTDDEVQAWVGQYLDDAREAIARESGLESDEIDNIDEDVVLERAAAMARRDLENSQFRDRHITFYVDDQIFDGVIDEDGRVYVDETSFNSAREALEALVERYGDNETQRNAEALGVVLGETGERFPEYREGRDLVRDVIGTEEVLIVVPRMHERGPNAFYRADPFVREAHYRTENVVVHARLTDVDNGDGTVTVLVDEVQSDLASDWRKFAGGWQNLRPYQSPEEAEAAAETLDAEEAAIEARRAEIDSLSGTDRARALRELTDRTEIIQRRRAIHAARVRLMEGGDAAAARILEEAKAATKAAQRQYDDALEQLEAVQQRFFEGFGSAASPDAEQAGLFDVPPLARIRATRLIATQIRTHENLQRRSVRETAVLTLDGTREFLSLLLRLLERAAAERSPAEVDALVQAFQAAEAAREALEQASEIEANAAAAGTVSERPQVLDGLPASPFDDQTSITLAMKRIIQRAAERNNVTKIAWTPAYVQAKRWAGQAATVLESVSWDNTNRRNATREDLTPSQRQWVEAVQARVEASLAGGEAFGFEPVDPARVPDLVDAGVTMAAFRATDFSHYLFELLRELPEAERSVVLAASSAADDLRSAIPNDGWPLDKSPLFSDDNPSYTLKLGRLITTPLREVTLRSTSGQSNITLIFDENGVVTQVRNGSRAFEQQAVGRTLAEVLTPGLADMVMGQPSGTVNAQNFVIGGEGYKNVYDRQIRKFMEKFVKPFGGKVEVDDTLTKSSGLKRTEATRQIVEEMGILAFADAAERAGVDLESVSAANIRQVLDPLEGVFDAAGRPLATGPDVRVAEQFVRETAGRMADNSEAQKFAQTIDPARFDRKTNPLWSVTITPEMREAARQPMTLFQSAPSAPRASIMLPPPGGVDPASVITLFDNADLSSALHELGHYHLFTLQTLVQSGAATPRMVRQWNTLNAWWLDNAAQIAVEGGVTEDQVRLYLRRGATGSQEIDMKVQTGIHELFARGFETYMLEGKAPSRRLQQVFDAFAAWLAEVYKRAREALGVTLTDEVREVFDQLLATDEELSFARAGQGGAAAEVLTLGAEMLAKNGVDADRLAALTEEAIAEARANALAEIMAPLRRERTAEGQALKKQITERISAEVHAKRHNRIREWLGNQRWIETFPGDVPAEGLPDNVRLSRRLLVEQYGPDILNRLPRGKRPIYADSNTIDPDDLASLFGYTSGDEMIRDLIESPPADREIAQRVRAELREALSSEEDRSAEQAATDALRNDKRAELYRAEVAALRKLGAKGSITPARVMKATARAAISRMSLRNATRVSQFLAAERRAGEAAQKALAKGDFDAALAAKRDQLINLELYRAAKEAAEVERKLRNKARQLSRRSTQQKIDAVQNDAIAAVLANYDFRPVSAATADHRAALRRYVEAMAEANRSNEVAIPKSVLDQATRVPYRSLTVEQARDVLDTLTNLEHTGRLKRELRVGQENRQRDAVAKEIAEGILANFKRKPRSRSPEQNRTLVAAAREYLSLVLNADTILRRIDGGNPRGTATLAIKDAIDKGSVAEVTMREQAARDLEALYSVYTGRERRQMTRRTFYPEIGESLSKWDIISLALNTGNEGNLQRLTDPKAARPMTQAQLEALLDRTMTRKDWEFVQSVWRYLDSFWPQIAERERRVTGVTPERVEPRTVRTRFGAIEGGYYPIVYDTELSAKALVEGDDELAMALMAGRFTKAQTKQDHLKERAAGGGGRTVQLGLQVLHNHVHTVIHDLALSEPVTEAWKLLQHTDVRAAFRNANANDELRALELWVLDVAAGQSMTAGWVSRFARHLRNGLTFSKLGFNLATVAIQITGLASSAVVVGKRNLALGISDYLRRGILPVAAEVKAVSPFMRDRELTFHRDVFDMLGETARGPVTSSTSKAQKLIIQAGLAALTKIQFYAVDMPTWLGAYRDGLKRFGNDEQAARDFADRQVARAQASGLFSDRTTIERGTVGRTSRQSEFLRLFTALGSYMFNKANVALERADRLRHEVTGFNLRSAAAIVSAMTDFALLFTLEAVAYAAIRGQLPDEDDDDGDSWPVFLAKQTVLTIAGTLPFVRDFAAAAQGFNGGGAFGSAAASFERLVTQVTQGEFDDALARSVVDITGIAIPGVPSSQLNRLFFSPDAEGFMERLLGVPRN